MFVSPIVLVWESHVMFLIVILEIPEWNFFIPLSAFWVTYAMDVALIIWTMARTHAKSVN